MYIVLGSLVSSAKIAGLICQVDYIQVLKRINSEIEARRKAGENLPPPPKTAIAGPEYFGLNQPEVCHPSRLYVL